MTLRFRKESLFTLLLILVSTWAVWESRNWIIQARLFPWAIGIPVFVLAVVQFGRELVQSPENQKGVEPGDETPLPPDVARRRTAAIFGWLTAFFLAIWLLGFTIAVPVLTFLYLKLASREKWPLTIALTVLAWGFLYGLFDVVLHLPLGDGQLLLWLRW